LPESASQVIACPVTTQPEIQEPAPVCSKEPQSAGQQPVPESEAEAAQQCITEDAESHCSNLSESQSPLSLKLVGRFSQRLSFTFGQPTVIRRTHLRSRPSIPFLESPILKTPIQQSRDGAGDSSDPSTTPSSNGSPLGYSTPPTPVTSAEPSPSSDKSKPSPTDLSTLSDCVSAVDATLGSKSQIILPSIVSAEAASVAKIYLELYYNSIFQNQDPRLQRQHELEQHIFAFQLAPDEQAQTRRNWLLHENEYLRQCRALKTSVRCVRDEGAVSIAGYEVIKVLGKGSFGVVRLVREKKNSKAAITEEDFLMPEGSPSVSRTRSLGMLRSAVDGAKHSRRRFMTGEKKEVYAMKVIRKSDMIRNCQEGHIRAERDFLVAAEKSRWVVPLITSFQDGTNLYLVMDYMLGGDFLGLLIRKDILREDWTKFYIAEMILCIEEAHRLCWIHRDIKPDNFLISASGHLKISDFGLAFNGHWSHDQIYYQNHRYFLIEKLGIDVTGDAEDQAHDAEIKEYSEVSTHGLNEQSNLHAPSTNLLDWRNSKGRRRFAKSVVGTSQYMAPEVIRGEMYDGRCDWWSLGVIIYEVSGHVQTEDIALTHSLVPVRLYALRL
jgi:serine/threonine protein kinase